MQRRRGSGAPGGQGGGARCRGGGRCMQRRRGSDAEFLLLGGMTFKR